MRAPWPWLACALAAHALLPRGRAGRGPTLRRESEQGRAPAAKFAERIESLKTGIVSGVVAAVAAAPVGLITHLGNLPQWEFDTDALALTGGLFGIVLRYALRDGNDPMVRGGVVGAFTLTRALAAVRTSPACTFAPLTCGAPLGYLDYSMLWQLAESLAESGIAFAAAAAAVDAAVQRGWCGTTPGASRRLLDRAASRRLKTCSSPS
ncbi:hypothetical protein M885DRAFT_623093 [Pelagophyceae sp. CCMP2097]|nr:hypothetical protein M885DRAFT_623093 [Pelagophyceae sp. CCMP2097]